MEGKGGGVGGRVESEPSVKRSLHEQEHEQRHPTQIGSFARLTLPLLTAVERGGERWKEGGGGRKRERNRSRSRERSDDAALATKRRRQAREGQHCEMPSGARHQVAHWGNVHGREEEG